MHSEYTNYLKNSTVFKNLESAEKKLKELQKSVNALVEELNSSGGGTIASMRSDVISSKAFITTTLTTISGIKQKLLFNASKFDNTLSNIEAKKEKWEVETGTTLGGSGLLGGLYNIYHKNVCQVESATRDSSDGNIIATVSVKHYYSEQTKGFWLQSGSSTEKLKYDVLGNKMTFIQ